MMNLRSQRGWILIDSLIALVILSVALTALAMAYRQASVTSYAATNNAQAIYLAQQQMEILKSRDNTVAVSSSLPADTYLAVNQISYLVQFSRPALPAGFPSVLYPVQVTVSWSGNPGGQIVLVQYLYYSP